MISDTKVNDSLPIKNYLIDTFSTPYRSDCEAKVGGIILFIRKDVQSKIGSTLIEGLHIELNLQNDKRLINCSYNPCYSYTPIDKLIKPLVLFSSGFDNMIILLRF